MLFVDHYTRFTWVYFLQHKSEVFSVFVKFKSMAETQFSSKLKTLRSDGGGEYISKEFKSYLSTCGILHQLSCPYTPQQNGLVERKHRHIIETTITLLSKASLPFQFWSYAVQLAIFLINLLPIATLQFHSPYFLLYHSQPDLHQLRIFGCACYPLLRPYTSHKLEPRTKECIFLGYSSVSKGYLCFDPITESMYLSRHVLFNESKFPFPTLPSSSSQPHVLPTSHSLWLSNLLYLHSLHQPSILGPVPQSVTTATPSSISISPALSPLPTSIPNTAPCPLPTSTTPPSPALPSLPTSVPPISSSSDPITLPIVSVNTHSMQTRSKSGISKLKLYYKVSLDYNFTEPPTYKIASFYPNWCKAMDAEFDALQKQ